MKLFAGILLMAILLTSLKLSPALNSAQMAFGSQTEASHCCSSRATDNTDCDKNTTDNDHDNSCCEDGSCHCLCCLHVVYFKENVWAFAPKLEIEFSEHYWNFQYFKDFQYSIFHPPLA